MSTTGIVGDGTWRRPDRRMLLVAPVEAVKEFLPLIVVAFVAGTAGGGGLDASNLAVVALPVVAGVWSWATTSYRVTDEQIVVRRGLVQRTSVTARLDRVRTVDVTASALQRLLGLAQVQVGTGSGSPVELPGIAAADARDLASALLHRARVQTSGPVGQPSEVVLSRLRPAWIALAPFSLSGLLALAAVAAFVGQVADDIGVQILESAVGHAIEEHVLRLTTGALILQGVLAGVVLLTVASTVSYVLRYAGYTLTRHEGGTLGVVRGLLTTRRTTVEERRLRGVTIVRPFLLRLVHGARADVLVTGLSGGGDGDTSASDLLIPSAPRAEVERVAAAVLGTPEVLATPLRRHGPAARRRRHVRALLGGCGLGAACSAATWWFGWAPAWHALTVALLLLAPVLAESRYRRLGHALTQHHLVSRHGAFPETTTVVLTSAVIGWIVQDTPFQRRVGLVTLTATIAAGDDRVDIPDVPRAEAEALIRAATPGLAEPFSRTGSAPVRSRSGTTSAAASRSAG